MVLAAQVRLFYKYRIFFFAQQNPLKSQTGGNITRSLQYKWQFFFSHTAFLTHKHIHTYIFLMASHSYIT